MDQGKKSKTNKPQTLNQQFLNGVKLVASESLFCLSGAWSHANMISSCFLGIGVLKTVLEQHQWILLVVGTMMRSPGWSGQDLAGLAGRVASDVHTLAFLDTVCSSFPGVPSGIPQGSWPAISKHPTVTCLLLEHCSLWCCHPEPPPSHGSDGGPQPICVLVWWGLPVCQAWACLRPCSSSGAHIRDVEVRHDLADHTEHMKSGCPQGPA